MTHKAIVNKIDASGKTLGRLSTEVVDLLRGKNKVDFSYNQVSGEKVEIFNAEKITFTGRKLEQKKYAHHSGYLGNLRFVILKDLFKQKPEEVIKHSVSGMLPNNRLKKLWLKNLIIHKGGE